MNIFELVRAVRKRLAVANTFELRIAKAQKDHYVKLWHDAVDRVSVVGAEWKKAERDRDEARAVARKAQEEARQAQFREDMMIDLWTKEKTRVQLLTTRAASFHRVTASGRRLADAVCEAAPLAWAAAGDQASAHAYEILIAPLLKEHDEALTADAEFASAVVAATIPERGD